MVKKTCQNFGEADISHFCESRSKHNVHATLSNKSQNDEFNSKIFGYARSNIKSTTAKNLRKWTSRKEDKRCKTKLLVLDVCIKDI